MASLLFNPRQKRHREPAATPGYREHREGPLPLEVGLVEPFGKPVEDRLEDRHRIRGTALIAQQPGKAYGGTQFPGQGALPPCPTQRLP
jgi:hypothetical protein